MATEQRWLCDDCCTLFRTDIGNPASHMQADVDEGQPVWVPCGGVPRFVLVASLDEAREGWLHRDLVKVGDWSVYDEDHDGDADPVYVVPREESS